MGIRENLLLLKKDIPDRITLVAVSKTRTIHEIMEAYETGHRDFGENKVQEIIQKQPLLPADIRWHFIGHLQTNKVKYITPIISLIHGVDSLKLLAEINRQAMKLNRIIPCLLQFHIATEESKFGLDLDEVEAMLKSDLFRTFRNVSICGVMGMATFTNDTSVVRREFKSLAEIFGNLKAEFFNSQESFKEISMGMTGDYQTAIEEGATMVRIGSALFGERDT